MAMFKDTTDVEWHPHVNLDVLMRTAQSTGKGLWGGAAQDVGLFRNEYLTDLTLLVPYAYEACRDEAHGRNVIYEDFKRLVDHGDILIELLKAMCEATADFFPSARARAQEMLKAAAEKYGLGDTLFEPPPSPVSEASGTSVSES